jgi:hypothetical protein
MILVGSLAKTKWIVFTCPCGQGHVIWLNAQRSQYPRWKVGGRDRQVTLWPSIWVGEPWGCHFWIRRGRVFWIMSA